MAISEFKTVEEFMESAGYQVGDSWYPRVTRIVEIKSKPALYRFYGRMPSFAEGEKMKNQSAAEGTMVHEAVEGLLLGQNPDIPPLIRPAVRGFMEYIERNHIKINPEFVEHRLASHEHRYAGTLDAVAEIGGKVGILDIKTSQEIYRDYNLQTSAYFYAMKEKIPNLETRWILRIDQAKPCLKCSSRLRMKGGRPMIKKDWNDPRSTGCAHEWGLMSGFVELAEFPHWENDFAAFLGAKKLWEWENEEWLKKAGYL